MGIIDFQNMFLKNIKSLFFFIHARLNLSRPCEAYTKSGHHWFRQCRLLGTKPLSLPNLKLDFLLGGTIRTNFSGILIQIQHVHPRKWIWKCLLNGGHIVFVSMGKNVELERPRFPDKAWYWVAVVGGMACGSPSHICSSFPLYLTCSRYHRR